MSDSTTTWVSENAASGVPAPDAPATATTTSWALPPSDYCALQKIRARLSKILVERAGTYPTVDAVEFLPPSKGGGVLRKGAKQAAHVTISRNLIIDCLTAAHDIADALGLGGYLTSLADTVGITLDQDTIMQLGNDTLDGIERILGAIGTDKSATPATTPTK